MLADINGKPLIAHVVKRANAISGVDHVVLAVPQGEVASMLWCYHVVGPPVAEADVLGRFAAVIERYPDADVIMRLTGDCPLFAPDLAEAVLRLYTYTAARYAWNVAPGYVDGTDVEVFSREALFDAHRYAFRPADREHVTPWMRRYLWTATVPPCGDYSQQKWSVDTAEDLERVRKIAQLMPPDDFRFQTTLAVADQLLCETR